MAERPDKVRLDENELAQHLPIIRNYIRRFLRPDEVEDGVQTVMQRALENRSRFRGESTARVWLLGIARNVGYEIGRARERAPALATDSQAARVQDIATSAPSQESLVNAIEDRALAVTAVDGLKLDDKLCLLVTYIDGLTGPEAAKLLGISFAAFRQRLTRARQALAEELGRLKEAGIPGSQEALIQWQRLLEPKRQDLDAS